MKLYDIDNGIMECVDSETGEIVDAEKLNALQMERDKKIENVALYIKQLAAEAEAIKAEEKKLAERRKAKENRAEGFKTWLAYALNGQALETAKVKLSFSKSEKLDITDPLLLLEYLEKNDKDDCVKYSFPEINKTAVKKLVKAGENIPGAVLVENQNLQIK